MPWPGLNRRLAAVAPMAHCPGGGGGSRPSRLFIIHYNYLAGIGVDMRKILVLISLAIWAICAPAWAQTVFISKDTDNGDFGELRTFLQDTLIPPADFGINSGINPSLNPTKGPIYIYLPDSILIGNSADITQTAAIITSLSGLWGKPDDIGAYMDNNFSTDVTNALSSIDGDMDRTKISGNDSRIFYWYSTKDVADSTKDSGTPGNSNGFRLENLVLDSGKVDLGTSGFHGGGVMGGHSSLTWKIADDLAARNDFEALSRIVHLKNVAFENIEVTASPNYANDDGNEATGGGVVGVSATSAVENWTLAAAPNAEASTIKVEAKLGDITDSLFRNIKVSAPDYDLSGGGVIGVMAESGFKGTDYTTTPPSPRPGPQTTGSSASLGKITGSLFTDIEVDFAKINGGGVVGLSASPALTGTSFGDMKDNIFSDIKVTATKAIEGGGLIGVKLYSPPATNFSIGSISDSVFDNISITAFNPDSAEPEGDLQGGGLIGLTLFSSSEAEAKLGSLDNLVFNDVSIKTGELTGGGLIGVSAGAFDNSTTPGDTKASAYIDSISKMYVQGTKVEAFEIQGGGLIGVAAGSNHGPAIATVKNITDSYFAGNSFIASGSTDEKDPLNGDIWGGIVYSGGGLKVTDSQFVNNTFEAKGTVYSSAITIDTAFSLPTGETSHSLSLEATAGQSTIIADNLNSPSSTMAGIYFGSLKLGELKTTDENGQPLTTIINLPSQADGDLTINPMASNSTVALFNPLKVDMTDSRAHDQSRNKSSFTMQKIGDGDFIWGGHNEILLHDSANKGSVALTAGTTFLANDFSLNAPNSSFTLSSGADLRMNLPGQPHSIIADSIDLESGSTIGLLDDVTGRRLYSPVLLSLSASGEIKKDSTLLGDGGAIEIGFYDYDSYHLEWAGNNLVLGGNRQENTARAAVSAITAPSAIAAQLPGSREVFSRIRGGLGSGSAVWESGPFAGSHAASAGSASPLDSREYRPVRLWLTPSYSYSSQSSAGRLSGYDISTPSIAFGLDYNFGQALVGVAVVGSWPDYESDEADVNARDITGLLYGGVKLPLDLDLALLLGFGYTGYDQTRRVSDQRISADYHSKNFITGAGLSREFALNEKFLLRPLASYEYMHIDVSGYDEGMGNNNLNMEGFTQGLHRLKAGAELEYVSENGLKAGAAAYYQGMYGDREATTRAFFNIDAARTPLPTSGNPVDEHSLGLGLFGEIPVNQNVSLSLGYDFLVGADTQSHAGNVSLKVSF
ncbi:hypothetical protein C4J81_16795 [Deltaproteobacteria bacterium Smac51]|nr:hypothetical protein C4J81_16795 [Deltaproteobacteria bacterium Smac51]